MSDKPSDEIVTAMIVICEILGKSTNANTVIQKFEEVAKARKLDRQTATRIRNLSDRSE